MAKPNDRLGLLAELWQSSGRLPDTIDQYANERRLFGNEDVHERKKKAEASLDALTDLAREVEHSLDLARQIGGDVVCNLR